MNTEVECFGKSNKMKICRECPVKNSCTVECMKIADEAWREFKQALIDVFKPICEPILKFLSKCLERIGYHILKPINKLLGFIIKKIS